MFISISQKSFQEFMNGVDPVIYHHSGKDI